MSSGVNASIARPDVLLRSAVTDEDIELRGEMRVGREQDCEIQLDDRHISRYHAKISIRDEGVLLEDLRSTNGTYVNGIRIQAPQIVSVGDELRFHHCLFRLVSKQSGGLDATVLGWPVTVEIYPPAAIPDTPVPAPQQVSKPPAAKPEFESKPEMDTIIEPDPLPDKNLETDDLFSASANDFEPVNKGPKRSSAIERQLRNQEQHTEKFIRQVVELPIGVWLALDDEEKGTHILCKLAAKSNDDSWLYFVSDLGLSVFKKGSRELALDLKSNRAHVLEKGPLLGRIAVMLTGAARRARNGQVTTRNSA